MTDVNIDIVSLEHGPSFRPYYGPSARRRTCSKKLNWSRTHVQLWGVTIDDSLHTHITGTKWVANYWVHEFGQELRRPCRPHSENVHNNYRRQLWYHSPYYISRQRSNILYIFHNYQRYFPSRFFLSSRTRTPSIWMATTSGLRSFFLVLFLNLFCESEVWFRRGNRARRCRYPLRAPHKSNYIRFYRLQT